MEGCGGGDGGGVYAPMYDNYKRRRKSAPKLRFKKARRIVKKKVKRIGGKNRGLVRKLEYQE